MMEIRYDVTDWEEQYNESNMRPSSADDAIDLMKESDLKLGEASMLLIVGREKGHVDDESLPSNKLSNLLGMTKHLSGYRSNKRAKVNVNGKVTTVPRYVSTPTTGERGKGDDSSEGVTTVEYNTSAAVDRCVEYLLNNVAGRIRERLSIIAVNDKKRLKRVAKELKDKIDEIVGELS